MQEEYLRTVGGGHRLSTLGDVGLSSLFIWWGVRPVGMVFNGMCYRSTGEDGRILPPPLTDEIEQRSCRSGDCSQLSPL